MATGNRNIFTRILRKIGQTWVFIAHISQLIAAHCRQKHDLR